MVPQSLPVESITEAVLNQPPVPPIRDWLARAIQTISYELGGLLIVGPVWKFATGASATESAVLLICLSAATMSWMVAYNTVFDVIEFRLTGLVASVRSHRWRIVHALGLEASSVFVTWPLILLVTDLGWLDAMAADLSLTLAYAIYGYFFHLGFDSLRPVRPYTASTIGTNRPISR